VSGNPAPGNPASGTAEAAWQAWYEPEHDIGRFMATSRHDEMHRAFLAGAAAERENIIRLARATRASFPAGHPEGAQASFADFLRVTSADSLEATDG
jgi:hypothetical protein